jgi:hypothetical protein
MKSNKNQSYFGFLFDFFESASKLLGSMKGSRSPFCVRITVVRVVFFELKH